VSTERQHNHRAPSGEVAGKSRIRLAERARLGDIVSSIRMMGAATAKLDTLRTSKTLELTELPAPSATHENNKHRVDPKAEHDTHATSRRQLSFLRETAYRKDHFGFDDLSTNAERLTALFLATKSNLLIASRAATELSLIEARRRSSTMPALATSLGSPSIHIDAIPVPRANKVPSPESNNTLSTTKRQSTDYLASMVASFNAHARYFRPVPPSNRQLNSVSSEVLKTFGAKLGSLKQPGREQTSFLSIAARNDSNYRSAHPASSVGIMRASNSRFADTIGSAAYLGERAIARRLTAADSLYERLDRPGNPRLPSVALPRINSHNTGILNSGEQWSASHPQTLAQPPNLRGSTVRPPAGPNEPKSPVVLNFSPTVVVPGDSGVGDITDAVMQAIRRQSHELIQIIKREIGTRKRARF
jgi:hypothetical protein